MTDEDYDLKADFLRSVGTLTGLREHGRHLDPRIVETFGGDRSECMETVFDIVMRHPHLRDAVMFEYLQELKEDFEDDDWFAYWLRGHKRVAELNKEQHDP